MVTSDLVVQGERCPECRAPVVRQGDELVCSACGLVTGAALPELPRPRAPVLGGRARGFRDRRRRPAGLARGERQLRILADALHVPEHARADAWRVFRRAHEAGFTQGRRLETVAAACLLEATRDRGVPRTLYATAGAAGVDPVEVGRALRALGELRGSRVLPAGPARILPAIASGADIDPRAVAPAAAILRAARLTGRRPEPLAAAALVLACRQIELRHSLTALSKAAGISRQAIYDALAVLSPTLSSPMNPLAAQGS